MAGEYKATCGCKIHVAQWTAKRKVVSQESCPLHKAAPELLAAAKAVWELLENGTLVRDTSKDYESGWAMKQIPIVRSLSALDEAIRNAEGHAEREQSGGERP